MAELEAIRSIIKEELANTNTKIQSIQTTIDDKISGVVDIVESQKERINKLENYSATDNRRIDSIAIQLEFMKQDRLRNNLRLTGLPPQAFERTTNTVMKIIEVLNLDLLPSEFIAYADRNKSSIIMQFDKYAHKRYFMDTLRARNELLVEEILPTAISNSKLYCNDQLTPYFSSIFQKAWLAKKNKQLFSASSLGGRIKVRKNENSIYCVIESEAQLNDIIDDKASTEVLPDNANGLPDSLPFNQEKTDSNVEQRKPVEITQYSKTHHSSSNGAADFHRNTQRAAHPSGQRSAKHTQQWQRMRNKLNHHHEQSRNGQRYRQQDLGRQIDLSPNKYRINNKPRQQQNNRSQPVRYQNRNYSNRQSDEEYY